MDPLQFGTAQPAENVICFHYRITERHRAYLMSWLKAGQRMGLHDADIAPPVPLDPKQHAGYVLIWVRENPDPAYRVVPEARTWTVIDELRNHRLGKFPLICGGTAFHPAGAFGGKRHRLKKGCGGRHRGGRRTAPHMPEAFVVISEPMLV